MDDSIRQTDLLSRPSTPDTPVPVLDELNPDIWEDLANLVPHDEEVGEENPSGPRSISEIRWRHTDESPENTPQNPLTYEKPERESETGTNLREEAARIRGSNESIDPVLYNVDTFQSWNVLRMPDWTNLPEEVNSLVVLLDHHGVNRDSTDLSKAIGVTYTELRKTSPDRKSHNWRGMKPSSLNSGPVNANELVRELTKIPNLSAGQFDAAVMSALACGEPMVAMQLICKADKLLPGDPKAIDNALSRLAIGTAGKPVFKVAYELYPKDLREKYDSVMAIIGEPDQSITPIQYGNSIPFGLGTLGNQPAAMELKARSEKALRETLRTKQNEWYARQEIVPTQKREDRYLGDQALLAVVKGLEASSSDGNPREILERHITEGSQRIVEGEVANIIAAELSRRMLADMNIESVVRRKKNKESGITEGNTTVDAFLGGNFVDNYLDNPDKDLNQQEKRQLIEKIGFGYQEFARSIIFPNSVEGIDCIPKHLMMLINNPNGYVSTYRSQMSEFPTRYGEEKLTHARRLAGPIEYLETVASNPDLRRVLEQEFGFRNLDEQTFENARAALTQLLPGHTEEEKKSAYQNIMGSEGQLDEDHRTVEQLGSLMVKEIKNRNEENQSQMSGKVERVISEEITRLDSDRKRITDITGPLSTRQSTASGIGVLRNQIIRLEEELERTKGLAEKSLLNRQGIPQSEKRTLIFGKEHEIGTAKTLLERYKEELVQSGGELTEEEADLLRTKSQELNRVLESIQLLRIKRDILVRNH